MYRRCYMIMLAIYIIMNSILILLDLNHNAYYNIEIMIFTVIILLYTASIRCPSCGQQISKRKINLGICFIYGSLQEFVQEN